MPHTCSRFVIVALTVLVASGCATPESEAPKSEPAVSAAALNLPDPLTADDCDCEELAVVEENYFDRGVRALAARDYDQAAWFQPRNELLLQNTIVS